MTTYRAGTTGYAPKVIIQPAPDAKGKLEYEITAEDVEKMLPTFTDEQKKYIKCWDVDQYREYSPGKEAVGTFLEAASPSEGETIVDWGCGSGKGSKELYDAGLDVTMLDFAFNCLDQDIKELAEENDRLRFVEHDIGEAITLPSTYGYCVDVMEHIPEERVDAVLDTILNNSTHVFFEISTQDDVFGHHQDIDEDLHLCVHDYQWWLEKLVSKTVVIHRSNVLDGRVIFYVTGWGINPLKFDGGHVNLPHETLVEHIVENAKLGLQPVKPHLSQETEVMLLGGGPTLNDFTDEIIEHRAKGMPMICTNGAYNWAIANGMRYL
jgi:hypothetical protein